MYDPTRVFPNWTYIMEHLGEHFARQISTYMCSSNDMVLFQLVEFIVKCKVDTENRVKQILDGEASTIVDGLRAEINKLSQDLAFCRTTAEKNMLVETTRYRVSRDKFATAFCLYIEDWDGRVDSTYRKEVIREMTLFFQTQQLCVLDRATVAEMERVAVEKGKRDAYDLVESDWAGRMQTLSLSHNDEIQSLKIMHEAQLAKVRKEFEVEMARLKALIPRVDALSVVVPAISSVGIESRMTTTLSVPMTQVSRIALPVFGGDTIMPRVQATGAPQGLTKQTLEDYLNDTTSMESQSDDSL